MSGIQNFYVKSSDPYCWHLVQLLNITLCVPNKTIQSVWALSVPRADWAIYYKTTGMDLAQRIVQLSL